MSITSQSIYRAPWRVETTDPQSNPYHTIFDADGKEVCQQFDDAPDMANQIAALPELLALAQAVVQAVVRDIKPKGAYYPLYDAARAALAKAGVS